MLVVLVVGGIAFVRWRDGHGSDRTTDATPTPVPSSVTPTPPATSGTRPAGVPVGVPATAQRLTVAFTRDGDTIEANAVSAAAPIATTDRIVIRLLGIDAPEIIGATGKPQCYARDAYMALQHLVPNASTIWVIADKQLRDQYQRYLLYVWNAKGAFVNLELATDGYARALSIKPNLAYQSMIDKAVATATAARRGRWGICVTKPK